MLDTTENDQRWMQHALLLAKKAIAENEVPVGAVITCDNELVSEGWNQPIQLNDPTAHAEIMALRNAAKKLNNYRLNNTTLYVTLEPCTMCVGAMIHARIDRLVFGAFDPKAGAVKSVFQLLDTPNFNHKIKLTGGVLSDESAFLLKAFFKLRR
ncbi:MAG: tRNA adenosine(34) deaminase TadA [Gammaproteobacteria bacterium]|nr:tRNA adenosine(34) deaminase TadA [Gammaproteobacteria bacterium]